MDANEVLCGKVTAIMPFGAFVLLDDKTSGLVHISEISPDYVKKVEDCVHIGMRVSVVCIGAEHDGKRRFSIKRANEVLKERGEPLIILDNDPNAHNNECDDVDQADWLGPDTPRRSNKAKKYTGKFCVDSTFDVKTPPPLFDEGEKPEMSFDEQLAKYIKSADERLVDVKHQAEGRRGGGYARR